MVSTAVDTLGTTLTLDSVPIGQIQDIDGPNLSTDTDEITNHDSPDGVEEFIATIKRTGEITFPLVFNPGAASHASLKTSWDDRTLDAFVMTYPDGSTWTFNAYTTGLSMTAPVAGHLSANVTLRPSGSPVWNPAS